MIWYPTAFSLALRPAPQERISCLIQYMWFKAHGWEVIHRPKGGTSYSFLLNGNVVRLPSKYLWSSHRLGCSEAWTESLLFCSGQQSMQIIITDAETTCLCLSSPLPPKVGEHLKRRTNGGVRNGKSAVKCCLLDVVSLLNKQTHSSCDYMHKIKSTKLPYWRGTAP